MFRCKAIVGSGLRARTLPAQGTEAKVGCAMLHRRPASACRCPSVPAERALGASCHSSELCANAVQRRSQGVLNPQRSNKAGVAEQTGHGASAFADFQDAASGDRSA